MRDIAHDNLTRFVGACVDSQRTCVLTEYCSKGSLQVSSTKCPKDAMLGVTNILLMINLEMTGSPQRDLYIIIKIYSYL